MKKLIGFVMLLAAMLLTPAMAAETAQPSSAAESQPSLWYNYDSGIAADGYDVVAYFSDNAATRGQEEFSTDYDAQTWHFSTAANRDAFVANPQKYIPQYGGYCAYAASLNALAFGDPKEWTVLDDKLYFNYNTPTRARWETSARRRVVDADKLWPKLVEKNIK